MEIKKLYKFRDCISESQRVYHYLKNKGYNPYMIEGYVEVNNPLDILPDKEFLFFFYPDELKKVEQDIYYEDYPKVLKHTWIEVNNHKIDITKNQFDIYNGISKYYSLEKYNIEV